MLQSMSQENKTEMVDKTMSVTALCLGDKVLDVLRETTATTMCSRYDSMYMTKSFAHN